MKGKAIAIICASFTLLTLFRLLWLVAYTPPAQPFAEDGVLDLSDYHLPINQTITLNGEWTFVPNTLHTDRSKNSTEQVLTVPDDASAVEDIAFGSYHLHVKLNPDMEEGSQFGIKIPSIATAYELYINGRRVHTTGNVSSSAQHHQGTSYPSITYFSTTAQDIDITLLVSNFDTNDGIGISKAIRFGSAQALSHERSTNQILTLALVIVLVLSSLFSVLVYVFIYRNKVVLFFTVGFLLPAIDELTTFNRALLNFLPLNYEWSTKFINLVYLGAAFFFIQLIRLLLARYREAKLFTYYTRIYVLLAALIIMLPVSQLTKADTSFFVLYAVSFLSVVVLALKEFITEEKTSIFIALTALCTTSGITWGAIKGLIALEIPFYPFDYLFAIICFSAFWIMHFARLKEDSDALVMKLQEMDTQKDAFLENSAVKLWGPLSEMITIGQSVYDIEQNMSTQSKKDMQYFIDIGRSMSFTLSDLLDFTKLQEQKIELHCQDVRIQTVIPALFDMLYFMTKGKKITLTSTIPQSFPAVYADEKQVMQILFNILHNAVKYTAKGTIQVRAYTSESFAHIEVQDTGIGIEPDQLSTVILPYEQLHTDDRGIGIGLTVSKKLIELHGGTLEITSTVKEGTTVHFSLPLVTKSTEPVKLEPHEAIVIAPTEEAAKLLPPLKHSAILIISNDSISLTVIESIFASEENHIVTTNHSKTALRLLDDADWDLIILDAVLPVGSGYTLTQLIRQRFSKLELPILLVTSRNYPIDIYTALALGANDHVTKPINSLELKMRGHALIDLKKSIDTRLEMETALLQAQIQPHFLFNTLNSISALSQIDPERMIHLLGYFGQYLQASFDTRNLNHTVPIAEELKLVQAYLYIEQERFQQRLTVNWQVPDYLSFDIPPLILQTLAENAIHHGLLRKSEGGEISITIEERVDSFFIQIADNGVGIAPDVLQTLLQDSPDAPKGIGLRNTNRRLLEIFGERLHVESKVGKGTSVTFSIPK